MLDHTRLPHPATAFKILTGEQWSQFKAAGVFHGAPIDLADGYIHMSTADQTAETLAKHFAGQKGLVIAEIDLSVLGDSIKWEVSRGGALFPHLYATLPITAVLGSVDCH
jgi:beta-hydroxylase